MAIDEPNFQDRMFLASEAVYAKLTETPDVTAALMDAQMRASQNEESEQ